MKRTLILIRHCKSDWSVNQKDHERPLNPRGKRDAPRLGQWLADEGLVPDEVLCSDATRAAETWDGIARALPATPSPHYVSDLYHAEPKTLLRVLHGATGDVVAMIGHNPGMLTFAWDLAEAPPMDPNFGTYPTGATTIFRFDAPTWQEIERGDVVDFVTPRSLR